MEKMSVLGLCGIKSPYVFQSPDPLFFPNFVTRMILVESIICILVMLVPPKIAHNEHFLPQITWVTQQVLKVFICVYKELALFLV
jgi:hypothetical protein